MKKSSTKIEIIFSVSRFIYLYFSPRIQTQWRNNRPCYPRYAGGRHNRSTRQQNGPNLGQHEKNIWGYKKLRGGKKPIRKTEKKSGDLFFVFGRLKFCGGGKKISRGCQMVTLRHSSNPQIQLFFN